MSKKRNITRDFIEENPDKPWDWWGISANPNITWDIIFTGSTDPMKHIGFSKCVNENPDRSLNWFVLSENPNILLSDLELGTIIQKHRSSKIIQKVWRRAVSNPNYVVCRKRLLWEFLEGNCPLSTDV
jgi:hypothetical protein